MELANEFEVPLSLEDAWRVLTDLERVAPCMPGAQLEEVEGSEYRGLVRVKVGPITVDYRGSASFIELDEAAHRAVLRASGRETRGQGNATAVVHASLESRADTTHVAITTDLDITGRVAQFGRGALADVSTRLLGQFAKNLAADLAGPGDTSGPSAGANGTGAPSDTVSATPSSGAEDGSPEVRRIDAPPAKPVRLTSVLAGPLAKRIVPIVAVFVALGLLIRRRLRASF